MNSSLAAVAATFKALGDPTRLRVFSLLRASCGSEGCAPEGAGAQRTLADPARHLGVGLPTVSHHLKELRQAGLVQVERRGRRAHCSMNEVLLRRLSAFLDGGESVERVERRAPRSKAVRA